MRAVPIVIYGLLYTLAFLALTLVERRSPIESLFVLVVFGGGMSGLAWWATRGLTPRDAPVRSPTRELKMTGGYLVALAAFITFGLSGARAAVPAGQAAEVVVLLLKLTMFVLLPYLLWSSVFGYRWAELFDLHSGLSGHWRPTIVMAVAVVLFQAVLGRAGRDWASVTASPPTIGAAAVVSFLWLLVDVGLVEELPFRGLVQTRLAAATGSPLGGLVGMAIGFGLAHAPGLYLRPELMGEAVSAHSSLLHAVAYSLVITSVSSFLYGILWLRTRNLWVVAIVHAAQDWLPTLVDALRSGVVGG